MSMIYKDGCVPINGHVDRRIIDRFFKYVTYQSGCWNWKGGVMKNGYGQFMTTVHVKEYAHRVSYQIFYGDIPEGLIICHKCDNKKCVNPAHLYAGTRTDNLIDTYSKYPQSIHRAENGGME